MKKTDHKTLRTYTPNYKWLKSLLIVVSFFLISKTSFSYDIYLNPIEPKNKSDQQAVLYFHKALSFIYISDLDSAEHYRTKYLRLQQRCSNNYTITLDYIYNGKKEEISGNYFEAINNYLSLLLSYEESLSPQMQYSINHDVAFCFEEVGAINLAVEFNSKSLNFAFSEEGQSFDWYYYFEDHALKLLKVQEVELAKYYFDLTLQIGVDNNCSIRILHSKNNLGYCDYIAGDYPTAKLKYLESIDYFDNLSKKEALDSIQCALAYLGLARCYEEFGEYNLQFQSLVKARNLVLPHQEFLIEINKVWYDLAKYYLYKKNATEAENCIYLLEQNDYDIIQLTLLKSEYHVLIGDYLSYQSFHNKFLELNNKIINDRTEMIEEVNQLYFQLLKSRHDYVSENLKFASQAKDYEIEKQKNKTARIVYVLVILVLLVVLSYGFIIYRRRLLIKEKALEKTKRTLAETNLESSNDKIQLGRERIDAQIKSLIEKNKLISDLQQKLGEDTNHKFPSKILTNDDWISFKSNVELIEPDLILRIENKFPKISNAELRLTLLLRLNFESFEISNILGISKDSVQKARTRLRKKFELDSSNNLESFIKSI